MLTLVMAYYDNGGMLDRHLQEWAAWPEEARQQIRVLLVDDASPNDPAALHVQARPLTATGGPQIELFRIGKNIPWNQNGARNLAMHHAPEGWCMMTDMDHLLTGPEALELVRQRRKGANYYVPDRVQANGAAKPRHPNSFILTREKFWAAGGYDEDFSGSYGSDKVFRRILDTVARRVEVAHPRLVLYGREVIPDASTTEWGRKGTPYHSAEKPHLVAKRKAPPYKAVDPLRFPWERIL